MTWVTARTRPGNWPGRVHQGGAGEAREDPARLAIGTRLRSAVHRAQVPR